MPRMLPPDMLADFAGNERLPVEDRLACLKRADHNMKELFRRKHLPPFTRSLEVFNAIAQNPGELQVLRAAALDAETALVRAASEQIQAVRAFPFTRRDRQQALVVLYRGLIGDPDRLLNGMLALAENADASQSLRGHALVNYRGTRHYFNTIGHYDEPPSFRARLLALAKSPPHPKDIADQALALSLEKK